MSEPETAEDLKQLHEKIDRVYVAVERTRKYMLWSFIMQLAVVLLPLVVLMFVAPLILSTLSGLTEAYQGL